MALRALAAGSAQTGQCAVPPHPRISLLVAGALLAAQAQAALPIEAGANAGLEAGAEAGIETAARRPASTAATAPTAPTLSLRVDNDVLGGQDQGYSNGIQLGLASGNYTVSLSQAIYTPRSPNRTDLIPNDRPYAATLLLGLGYNARDGDSLQSNLIQVGIVGPSARGRQSQNNIHKLTGDKPFLGWDNQLRDEGLFRLLHERRQRHPLPDGASRPNTARPDAVTHWGASVGNLLTQFNLGGELRWGRNLPDDFGSAPTGSVDGPVGLPGGASGSDNLALHGFASVDARWVLRDLSLDGNAFQRSHRVAREPLVADFGYGIAMSWGAWRMVLARFHRTREFEGQPDRPIFGSLTASRSF